MITYIFKSSLSLIILFGLYWFLLRKEKLFVFNRFFLMSSVVFSLIVPFISIPVNFQVTPQITGIIPSRDYVIQEISNSGYNPIPSDVFSDQTYVETQHSSIKISSILFVLYISGVILFLIRFLRNIYIIIRRTRLSEKISFNGYGIVLTNDKTGPCCFFSNIFLNRDDYLNGRIDRELLDHELEHVRQSHTVDIILIELIKIFYWFNPVHLLYDRAIRINHEYLADNGVISDDHDIESYVDKLIGFIVGKSNIPLTSGSNHSFTKKRLLMMTKTKSKSFIYGLRITITLSLTMVFFLLISFTKSNGLTSAYSQTPTVKDIDGNVYKTVTIGNYVWMAENLKTTKYNDGKNIPLVTDDEQWQKYEQAYCWYNNDEKLNKNIYGALYNWYAVKTGKLCPSGWHVPEWEELEPFAWWYPRDTLNGGKLKETSTVHWRAPNTGATNETGYTGLPAGLRLYSGKFILQGERTAWWTSGEYDEFIGSGWLLDYNFGGVNPTSDSKRIGYSVRCIKDYPKGTSVSAVKSGEITKIKFRGIVMTEDGIPLFGATVTVTGTINKSQKVTADFDGRFIMNDMQPGLLLLIECSGFIARTIMADSESEMVVKLVRDPDYKGKVIIPVVQNVNFRNSDFKPAKALLVINGEIIDYNGNLRVNPGEIKSFNILKNKEATSKYGEKAKDGAVEIILYGNKTESVGKKLSNSSAPDSSKYKTLLGVNHTSDKGELIHIPVSNLQYLSVWTYHDIDKTDKKELRGIVIMTRDYYKVKGRVVRENGKPLPGVKISATDNPVTETSDKEGRFLIEDVREGALLEFSLQGYKPYFLSTSFEVAFNIDLTIELKKDNVREKDDI